VATRSGLASTWFGSVKMWVSDGSATDDGSADTAWRKIYFFCFLWWTKKCRGLLYLVRLQATALRMTCKYMWKWPRLCLYNDARVPGCLESASQSREEGSSLHKDMDGWVACDVWLGGVRMRCILVFMRD
jgi:hypothetical protein